MVTITILSNGKVTFYDVGCLLDLPHAQGLIFNHTKEFKDVVLDSSF